MTLQIMIGNDHGAHKDNSESGKLGSIAKTFVILVKQLVQHPTSFKQEQKQ